MEAGAISENHTYIYKCYKPIPPLGLHEEVAQHNAGDTQRDKCHSTKDRQVYDTHGNDHRAWSFRQTLDLLEQEWY